MRGSVRETSPGRWQVRISLGKDAETGEYRYVSRQVAGGKREAQRAAAKLVAEVERGEHRQKGHPTVEQLMNRWMAHIESQGRATSTLVRYRWVLKTDIIPKLGSVRIDRLTPAQLDGFYAGMTRSGLSPLSVRKAHAMLSAAFNQALKWDLLDRSPVVRASPPPVRQREIVPPTLDEVRRLLIAAEETNPDLASLIYVAMTTGCRRGELCGLRWSDLDLEAGTVVVARSVSDSGGLVELKDTKTHQARRLALDPSTQAIFRAHRLQMAERAAGAGMSMAEGAYVWSQTLSASKPYRPDRVTGQFKTLTRRLGIPHVTFHTLRHFSATALAGQGISVRTIAGRLGHANPSVTLRTYAHFLEAADRDAALAMGTVLGSLAATDRASDTEPR